MKNDRLEIGKIVNTHGIRGEVKVVPWTDYPEFFEEIEWVYVKVGNDLKKLHIESIKYQKNNVILKIKEISSIEEAEKYKNIILLIDREMAGELPEGTYYICDLIGLDVQTEEGQNLGKIDDVLSTGSNDVYIVKNSDGKELLIPALKDVLKKVDLDNNLMVVKLPEGLIDIE